MTVSAADIFKETTTYFGICLISLFSLPAACGFDISSFSVFSYHSMLFLRQGTRLEPLEICVLILCKGRRLHLSRLEKIILNPLFVSVILMQYYSILMFVFSCVMAE